MNLIILLLFLIKVDLIFLKRKDSEKVPLYFSEEEKTKALACSFLLTTPISTEKNNKKQIRELLIKNGVIKRKSGTKQKINIFLISLCYRKIKDKIANDLLEEISENRKDILANKELAELFNISPNLNYKKIQKTMDIVNDILEQIDEDDSKYIKYKDENMDDEEKKKSDNTFSFKKIINDIKEYFEDFEIETKTLYGIVFSLSIIIITIITCLCKKKNKIVNNKGERYRGKSLIKENANNIKVTNKLFSINME